MSEVRDDNLRRNRGRGIRALFFFNDTATTEIYTLALHDALPISPPSATRRARPRPARRRRSPDRHPPGGHGWQTTRARSEEHTSELQSRQYLVCRLLLEKKKKRSYECRTTIGSCLPYRPTPLSSH